MDGIEGESVCLQLRRLRLRSGLSMDKMASAMGYAGSSSYQRYEDPEKYTARYLPFRIVEKVLVAIGGKGDPPITAEEIYNLAGPVASRRLASDLPPSLRAEQLDLGPRDLPILGRAQGGAGELIITADHEPIDWTYRPAQLRGVREAFAVYATGESMYPMFKPGQTLLVRPNFPLIPTRGVLIEKNNDEALIKEYASEDRSAMTVREYRPTERTFTIPLSEIRRAARIVGVLEI
jgi:hypothetical protein